MSLVQLSAGVSLLSGINAGFAETSFLPITERIRIQLRGEAFNATNRVNPGLPNTGILSTAFGRIAGKQTPARIVQIGAKLIF